MKQGLVRSRVWVGISLLALVSCTSRQTTKPQVPVAQRCPEFSEPQWYPLAQAVGNAEQLINQQTFALRSEQSTYWFSSAAQHFIGLCILPEPTIKRRANDCGTIYVTYQKKEDDWQLLSQQVTICPG
jgi:hypothetical protein